MAYKKNTKKLQEALIKLQQIKQSEKDENSLRSIEPSRNKR